MGSTAKFKVNGNSVKPPAPINLRDRFGHRYQIGFDPAYYAERPGNRQKDDPWLQVVVCRFGEVFPWGGPYLAAATISRGAIANRLAALPCCKVVQDGSDGVTVVFDVADFAAVAKLIKPRGIRRLDPERKRAFIEAGRATRYGRTPGHTEIS